MCSSDLVRDMYETDYDGMIGETKLYRPYYFSDIIGLNLKTTVNVKYLLLIYEFGYTEECTTALMHLVNHMTSDVTGLYGLCAHLERVNPLLLDTIAEFLYIKLTAELQDLDVDNVEKNRRSGNQADLLAEPENVSRILKKLEKRFGQAEFVIEAALETAKKMPAPKDGAGRAWRRQQ